MFLFLFIQMKIALLLYYDKIIQSGWGRYSGKTAKDKGREITHNYCSHFGAALSGLCSMSVSMRR